MNFGLTDSCDILVTIRNDISEQPDPVICNQTVKKQAFIGFESIGGNYPFFQGISLHR
jgi:hypothetical protein